MKGLNIITKGLSTKGLDHSKMNPGSIYRVQIKNSENLPIQKYIDISFLRHKNETRLCKVYSVNINQDNYMAYIPLKVDSVFVLLDSTLVSYLCEKQEYYDYFGHRKYSDDYDGSYQEYKENWLQRFISWLID